MKLLMVAAHGGFGSECVPLGGGAAIFERLCYCWQTQPPPGLELLTAGAGPHSGSDLPYQALATPPYEPSRLGAFAYARFCRAFERATTEWALKLQPDLVLAHDISEGPNINVLRQAGIPVATIFHVDVVDIFNRLYLGKLLAPEHLTRTYRALRRLPWPDVLKLVFEKQQVVLESGALQIVPSSGAAQLLKRCYPHAPSPIATLGWGVPPHPFTDEEVVLSAQSLREAYQIPQDHRVILSLSRLSPEKAQHRLLEALLWAEQRGVVPPSTSIVIAGAPAFMRGQAHFKRLKCLAQRLRTPVYFPGHVGGLQRAGWYRTAQVMVVASLHESYGLTTLEAMQHGCPVVAVESFGTAVTVTPSCGLLVPAGRELCARLWKSIEAILLSPHYTQLRQGALQQAQRLNFSATADKLLSLLQKHLP